MFWIIVFILFIPFELISYYGKPNDAYLFAALGWACFAIKAYLLKTGG
jgi:hypothetical protein